MNGIKFPIVVREIIEPRHPLAFDEQAKKKNELKILNNCHRAIWNLIKLSRYEEAADRSVRLAGILRTWQAVAEKQK